MKKIILIVFLLVSSISLFAQQKISGTVLDVDTQDAVIGANISVKSSNEGTVSDANGRFVITPGKSVPLTLVISYLGYTTQEIDVYEVEEPLVINLAQNTGTLEEVVVVGYTTAKKSSYTGSVAVVSSKELEKLQVTTVGKALQGTVPGLQSIAAAGQPGSDASLYIRGIGSVNASSSPLYVVDGVPGASVSNISGKDIQSISVLKDATASALYGSRGANGVIVITTKSGNLNSKASVNFSASYGFTGRAVKDYEYLTNQEYYELQWEAIKNTQLDQGKTETEAAQYASANLVDGLKVNIWGPQYPVPVNTDGKLVSGATPLWDDDWGEAISRQGIRQQYDLSVSGGSANTKYFFSGGYLNENGWIVTSEYERYHLRTSIQSKVTNWFEAGANISASTSYQKSPTQEDSNTGNYANFQRLVASIYPVYERNPDGTFVLDENGNKKYDYGVWRPSTAAAGSNILGSAAHSIFGSKSDAVSLRTNFNITFLKGLLWKTTVAGDYSAGTSHSYSHSYYSTGVITEGAGSASRSSSRNFRYTVNSFIDYSLDLDDKHFFSLLGGPEIYVTNSSSLSGSRSGFQVLGKTEPSAGTTSGTFSGTSSDYHLSSWLGKLDYDFLHRYYFSASIRRDGSSRFSKQSRWGNFWSLGASWNVKSESFLKNVKDINNLNLRLSYGAQGNDNVGNYAYGGFYSIYNSLDQLGLLPSDLPTPELKWETNLNLNFGVDIALFNNRLIAQIDIFNRQSKDLLFTKPLAPSSGYSGISANIGSLSNRGIDGQIQGTPVLTRNFKWNVILNFGHYTNKITKLPQKEIISGNKRMAEGSSVYDYYIKEWAGVNPENGKALWYKNEVDENGNVTGRTVTENQNEATFDYHGSSLPDIYGGLGNTFSYKGIELSFLISYNIGGYVYDGDYVWVMHSGYSPGRNWSKEALTRWTPENTNTDFPRLSYISDTWNTTVSTRFLYSATYARLKQFSLSYSLPRKLINAVNLKNVKIGVNGENLLTLFGHQGLDPEQTVSGSTYYRYPAQKAVSFTLDVSF
jgi:TonB-linked SusC/RagA family outer membrane protein